MKINFTITGMSCAACSARVEKVTSALPGVNKADVNLLAGTMVVEAVDPNVSDAIIKAILLFNNLFTINVTLKIFYFCQKSIVFSKYFCYYIFILYY